MKNLITALVLAVLLAAAPSHLFAQALKTSTSGVQTFNLKDARNQASFVSDMSLETFRGTTNDISGALSFDPSDVAGTIKGEIVVGVASIKTGIDMRDGHLRSKAWMDAAAYPTMTFAVKGMKNVNVKGNVITGTAFGNLTIHGVTRPKEVEVRLVFMEESMKTKMRAPGNLLVIKTAFDVRLTSYGINGAVMKGMKILGTKVNDVVQVQFNGIGFTGKMKGT